MSIASSWRAKILESSAVTALIGTRFYPNTAPQTPIYPLVVYKRREGRRDYSIDGPSEMTMALYEVTTYSDDYSEAWSVYEAITAQIDGFKGTSGGINYVHNLIMFDRDDYDDKIEIHKVVAHIDVWYVVA